MRDGRKLMVFRDGKRVRLVAWRTRKAVYWVSNTLTQSLSSQQMIGIAASLQAARSVSTLSASHERAPDREPIGVIGTGYVGLVTAAGFAALGSDVYCVDIDAEKIRGLKEGRIPIWEPGLEDLIAEHRERLHFSTELAPALEHARLLFVAVGTPPTYSGDADLSAVHAVVDAMPASDRHALVMKSTVPVGTGESIERVFAEQGKGFRYVSCPEFLKEGSAVKDFLDPDRVVIGDHGDWAGDAVEALYAPLDAPIVRTDVKSAEMVKLASNAFLARRSRSSTRSPTCARRPAPTSSRSRAGWAWTTASGRSSCRRGSASVARASPRARRVLARVRGQAQAVRFDALWDAMDGGQDEAVAGDDLEVLSWVPGEAEPEYLPVSVLTRRRTRANDRGAHEDGPARAHDRRPPVHRRRRPGRRVLTLKAGRRPRHDGLGAARARRPGGLRARARRR